MPRTLVICLALVGAAVVAAPAHASATWLDQASPFGDVPARQADASAAMAPDGTIVFARLAPGGAMEVRERPPGGPIGATITIPPVAVDPQPFPNLNVLVGADGTAAVLIDAGNFRYASTRAPGGTWTRPDVVGFSGAGSGQEAIGPDGVLWVVGPALGTADRLTVFRTEPGGRTQAIAPPAPPPGTRQLSGTLTTPPSGGVRVLYAQEAVTVYGEACTRTTAVLEDDISEGGAAAPPTVLDERTASGRGPADACALEAGGVIRAPLLATDAAGADTAVYTELTVGPFEVRVRARHRAAGQAWPAPERPAEVVGDEDAFAEQVLGGAGAPLVVMRELDDKAVSTRGPDGVWTAPAVVATVEGARPLAAARTGTGTTVFAWVRRTGDAGIFARVAAADGTLGERQPLAEAGAADTLLAVGGDEQGNALALYTHGVGNGLQLRINGYDAAGPRLSSVAIPPRATVGDTLTFSVSALDVWSGPRRTADWDFGDGTGASGLAAIHTYSSGGPRTVTVRAEDDAGNATTASRALTVSDAAPQPAPVTSPSAPSVVTPPRDARAPVLGGLSIHPRRPRAGHAPTLVLTTDEAGTLDLTLTRIAPGVKRGRRCVARSRGERTKPCTRTLARVDATRPLAAGARQVRLPRLAAGTWMVTATVTDAAGNHSTRGRLRVRVA